MKKQSNSFSDVKKQLENKIKKIIALIELSVLLDAKSIDGKESLKQLWEQFHHKFQEVLDELNLEINPTALVFETSQQNLLCEQNSKSIDVELDMAKNKQLNITNECNEAIPPFNKFLYFVRLSVHIAISIFEGILIMPVFYLLGFSFLLSFGLAFLFSIILYFYIDLIPKLIKLGQTKLQRIIIAGVVVIFTIIFFRFLSSFRMAHYASQLDPASIESFSNSLNPWSFVIISLFLVGMAVAINYFYPLPTKTQWQEMREYMRLYKNKRKADQEVKRVNLEKEALTTTTTIIRKDNASSYINGADLEEFAISKAESSFVTYKRLLAKYSNENSTISNAPYPFLFRKYFTLNHK